MEAKLKIKIDIIILLLCILKNHAVTKALFSASLRILRNAIYHIYPLTGDYYYYCTILLFYYYYLLL